MMLEGQADRLIDDLVSMCQLSPVHLQLFYEQPLDYLRQEYGTRRLLQLSSTTSCTHCGDLLRLYRHGQYVLQCRFSSKEPAQ